jgi:hypothetical protein
MRTKFWLERLNGQDHLEDLDIDGRITEASKENKMGGCGLDSSGSG